MRKLWCFLLALVACCMLSTVVAAEDTTNQWYCQHCRKNVSWTVLDSSNYAIPKTTAGEYHYYLAGEFSKYLQLCSGANVCLDLCGNNINVSGRAILANAGATLNLMDSKGDGYVAGGPNTNNPRGGTITVTEGAVFNLYGGTLKYNYASGSTTHTGGVAAINGTMNMYGGRVEGTTLIDAVGDYGAAIYVYKGSSATKAGTLNLYGGTVTSGTLPADGLGECVYVAETGSLTLSGNPNVDNIYFAANEKLFTVENTYSGNATVTFASNVALGAEVGVAKNATVTGLISCTNGSWLILPADNALVVSLEASVAVVTEEGSTGYKTLQAAIEACESGYVKLLRDITENVTIDKDLCLDLNGCTITGTVKVSEGKTLSGMDSQTDDYTVDDAIGYGQMTVSGNVVAQEGYLLLNEDGKVSFHRVTLEIHTMSLRPAEAGLYYKSRFLGDEKVAEKVESFGVALSVQGVPEESNLETACKYSVFTTFESGLGGNASTSTLVKGILKEHNSDETNSRNLNLQIFGRPYIQTADGYIFGEPVNRSMCEQLQKVDALYGSFSGNQKNALITMYETFQKGLTSVTLSNIVAEKTRNDETLSILMVGNSFCYYYVEELYGLLMANPNRTYQNVEIYNLYRSGGKLIEHYQWWIADEANYDGFYKTDANGRKELKTASGEKWKLEDALQQGRWDYISIQGASGEFSYEDPNTLAANCAYVAKYAEPLLARFNQLHPYAQLLWHRTWAFEIGRISGSKIYDAESCAAYDAGIQALGDYVCNEFDQDKPYDLKMVNSGAAWAEARRQDGLLETSLLPIGGLCARLGVANAKTYQYAKDNPNATDVGDGYHDGDIGGGQFLNACVWYETLTGQSVLDNPYAPNTTNGKYTLSDALVNLLRNAAQTALNK